MKKLVIASLVSGLLLSNVVEAANWVFLSKNVSGSDFYVDKDSTRIKGNIISGWFKMIQRDYSSSIGYDQYDCVNMRTRMLEWIDYSSNGDIVNRQGYPSQWSSIIPDSSGETMWEKMCIIWKYGKQTGNSTSRFRVE